MSNPIEKVLILKMIHIKKQKNEIYDIKDTKLLDLIKQSSFDLALVGSSIDSVHWPDYLSLLSWPDHPSILPSLAELITDLC